MAARRGGGTQDDWLHGKYWRQRHRAGSFMRFTGSRVSRGRALNRPGCCRPYLFTVAQIFNLPYRRFVMAKRRSPPRLRLPPSRGASAFASKRSETDKTRDFADDPQVTNLRYSRLQVCATSVGNAVNRYCRPRQQQRVRSTTRNAAKPPPRRPAVPEERSLG